MLTDLDNSVVGGIAWSKGKERRLLDSSYLEAYNYKVYSQNGEDGIIDEIFKRIGIKNKTFFEIGVQNGLECNTHFLLMKGWKGVWVEQSRAFCAEIQLRFESMFRTKHLSLNNSLVTAENIDGLIMQYYGGDELDFLSIDIDGNDYYVWKNIIHISPRVVCIEYNGKFPPDFEWKQNYDPDFVWDGSDWHGASLKALESLGENKGYTLVATDLAGVNAFFVRNDLVKDSFPGLHTSEDLFNACNSFRFEAAGHPSRYCLADTRRQHRYGAEGQLAIFPFECINYGETIAIWGGGILGHCYARQISTTSYCKISFIADINDGLSDIEGISVMDPCVADFNVDKVVIAVLNQITAEEIRNILKEKGIKDEKIIWNILPW